MIEILIVVAILVITTGIIIISLSQINSSQALDKGTSLVVSVLDEARSLTLSAKDDSQYGVYFQDSGVILFKGDTYSSFDPENVLTTIDNRLGLRNFSLVGGGSSVAFKRLKGSTNQYGTLEVFLKASTTMMHTINISATGVIDVD